MFFGVLFWLLPLAIFALVMMGGIAIGTRREPDPTGQRTFTIYLLAVIFVSLFAGLVALAGTGDAATKYILTDGSSQENCVETPSGVTCSSEFGFVGGGTRPHYASQLLTFGLVLAVSIVLAGSHLTKLRALRAEPEFDSSGAERVYRTYVYLVSFILLTVSVVAGIVVLIGIVRLVAPGAFSDLPAENVRDSAYASLASSALAGLPAALGLRFYLSEGVRSRGRSDGVTAD